MSVAFHKSWDISLTGEKWDRSHRASLHIYTPSTFKMMMMKWNVEIMKFWNDLLKDDMTWSGSQRLGQIHSVKISFSNLIWEKKSAMQYLIVREEWEAEFFLHFSATIKILLHHLYFSLGLPTPKLKSKISYNKL